MSAVVVRNLGDIQGFHFLVAWRGHLERCRKVRPQLKSMHAAGRIALGHLLVNDAAACSHPLHIAGRDRATIPHAVAVLDRSGKHVRDGLDAAVRMPGKARQIILGDVIAEIVEQEKRIEILRVAKAERTAQMHTRSFEGRFRLYEALHWSNGHVRSTCKGV